MFEKIKRVAVINRFRYGQAKDVGIPLMAFKFAGWKILNEANAQGYGRHSQMERK